MRRPRAGSLLGPLLCAALVLHELGYLLARTACERGEGLGIAVTIGVAIFVSAAWSVILVPILSRSLEVGRGLAVAAVVALALLSIFLSQETVESLLLGDHPAAAQAVLAVLAPLCMAFGALAACISRLLYRVAVAIVSAVAAAWRRIGHAPAATATRSLERGRAITASPLAYGLAKRPPPAFA